MVTREQIEPLWYDADMSNRDIAEALGLNSATLWQAKKHFDLPDRITLRDPDEATIARLCAEIREGWSDEEREKRFVGKKRRRWLVPGGH